MTLTYFRDNMEIFNSCCLWWQGRDETALGFPILPAGVTVTPNGTWANPLSLGNNYNLKTFDGSSNYVSLSDNDAWSIYGGDFTVLIWVRLHDISSSQLFFSQWSGGSTYVDFYWNSFVPGFRCYGFIDSNNTFSYDCVISPQADVWYYVVLTRSGVVWTYYINSVYQSTVINVEYVGILNIAAPLVVGNISTAFMNGNIKDLMLFKGRALDVPTLTMIMKLTDPRVGNEIKPPIIPGVRGVY